MAQQYNVGRSIQADRFIPHTKVVIPKQPQDSQKGTVKTDPVINRTNVREFKEELIVVPNTVTNGLRPGQFKRLPAYHVNDLLSHDELKDKNTTDTPFPLASTMGIESITWKMKLEGTPKVNPFYTGIFNCTAPRKRHTPKAVHFPILTFSMASDVTSPYDWAAKLQQDKKLQLKIPSTMLAGNLDVTFPNKCAVLLSVHLLEELNSLKMPFDMTLSSNAYSGNGKLQQWISVTGPNDKGTLNQTNLHYVSYPNFPPNIRKYNDKPQILWCNDMETVNGVEFGRWINESREEIDRLLQDALAISADPEVYMIRCPDKDCTTPSNMLQFLVLDEFRRIGGLTLEWKQPLLVPGFKRQNDIDYFTVSKRVLDFLIYEKFELIAKKDEHIIRFDDLTLTLTPVRLENSAWIEDLKFLIKKAETRPNSTCERDYHPNCVFKLQLTCEVYEGNMPGNTIMSPTPYYNNNNPNPAGQPQAFGNIYNTNNNSSSSSSSIGFNNVNMYDSLP